MDEKRVCAECGAPAVTIRWTHEASLTDTRTTRVPAAWRCTNRACISQQVPADERLFEIVDD